MNAASGGTARRLLLLGGTTEASALARELVACRIEVITSLAGRTSNPRRPPGQLRIGGFGGAAGLEAWLRKESIGAVVDATHPFAAVMRWNAATACETVGVPRLRLERPPWSPTQGDRWRPVTSLRAAADEVVAARAERVMLTTGRSDLASFAPAVDGRRWWLLRSIEPPDPQPLAPAEVILDRGPFSVEGETSLLRNRRIDLLVTKNSGGSAAAAKLVAARALGIEVVIVTRPPSPPGPGASTVSEAVAWAAAVLGTG
ncbi:cobalt-precorrin-6A reductase [Acidiferrimicrobium sp. IK]|uniref:cobalt-precorrin-6A reductase n=1 Tax=Acidiferrimicrobium sp. IK TaxID=2871700 RepID=UPI0021CB670A|nr:cobalt-precorrin-6A reductase [Acidiferrimicrobium sp. IK]MCU4186273.1 cobalt-precorrin-6A reductase [Acidiferrimicrobium sp. IK]